MEYGSETLKCTWVLDEGGGYDGGGSSGPPAHSASGSEDQLKHVKK